MQKFIEYLTGLAQAGETMLFVKQKEKKAGGYAYIPCLPEKMAGEGAWYGNTGIYILDRFTDGKLSASKENIEYVAVMVLDDIGTKSKTPPLAPTWIMETSEGNYQWGYCFSEQPPKADFTAAIKAIAAAGYSDPGATNAVRNFRIPGSINKKEGKAEWRAKLIEFHPDREFDLDQICAALGVTPGEVQGEGMRPIHLVDDGKDDVMGWLAATSLVLERTNSAGWAGVICPNAAEHTDGHPMGRYMPSTRAYACFHGHCGHVTSQVFLDWVAAQGGPAHEAGLRDDLLAATMTTALGKIDRSDSRFSAASDSEAALEEVERKELQRLKKEELHDHFCYVASDRAFFSLDTRKVYTTGSFNDIYAGLPTNTRFGKGKGENHCTAAVYFNETRETKNSKVLDTVTYAPGDGVLVAEDGDVYGNQWRDARLAGKPGDLSRWFAHVEAIIPEKAEREHIYDVFAYKYQNPRAKINHAILLAGNMGIGKDTALAPMIHAICGNHTLRNHDEIKEQDFESQFNYQYEVEILAINELRASELRDRRALENRLKPIIAAPPDKIRINKKGLAPYSIPNRVLVIAGSNYRDSIAITTDDRRWFVVWATGPKLDKHFSDSLWRYYHAEAFEACALWLAQRDVSAFYPGATPPMTQAKALMIDSARSGAEEYLVSLIAGNHGPFARGFVGGPFTRLVDTLQLDAGGNKVNKHLLEAALLEAGWIDLGHVHCAEYHSKRRIYARPDIHEAYSKSELRRMIEPDPEPAKLVAVK